MKLNDKIILDYVAPNGKLIPQRCIASVLKKNNFYDYIINRYNSCTVGGDGDGKNALNRMLFGGYIRASARNGSNDNACGRQS